MVTALAILAATQASLPPLPPVRARLVAAARIIHAAEVKAGVTSEPHQRRTATRDNRQLTLIEFE